MDRRGGAMNIFMPAALMASRLVVLFAVVWNVSAGRWPGC